MATRSATPKRSGVNDGGGTPSAPRADARALRAQGHRTHAKLLDAGMVVLRDRGYHAARVDDVVRIADVSHGTFYLYFTNKEDLFRALATQCAEEMTSRIGSLGVVDSGADGLAELERWVDGFVTCYAEYGVVIRAWMEDQVSSRDLARLGTRTFRTVSATLVARLAEASPDADEGEVALSAAALVAMIERFTYFVTSRGLDLPPGEVVRTLAALIHRGFFHGSIN